MSVITTRIELAITAESNDECTSLIFNETTGNYNVTTNPLGYGCPGGITLVGTTTAVITVNIGSTGLSFIYTFTLTDNGLGGVSITDATLTDAGGGVTNIFALLPSTTWPLVDFDLWDLDENYGVTLPTFQDDAYEVDFTISGNYVPDPGVPDVNEDFDYTTSCEELVICATCCCINKMFADLEPDCACDDKALTRALNARAFLDSAEFNFDLGVTSKTVTALAKAKEICDGNCESCN